MNHSLHLLCDWLLLRLTMMHENNKPTEPFVKESTNVAFDLSLASQRFSGIYAVIYMNMVNFKTTKEMNKAFI